MSGRDREGGETCVTSCSSLGCDFGEPNTQLTLVVFDLVAVGTYKIFV